MSTLLTFPAGRRAKWLVIAVWVAAVVGSIAANLPGKFADAEQNESTSFLPGDAESTKALQASERLTRGEQAAIIVIYRRSGSLTDADRARIADDRRELNALNLRSTTPFGEPTPSRDGSGALMSASITADGESETIIDPVDAVRDRVSDPGGGLQAKVTGPAGFSADAIKIFENIDGTLLLAAVSLVFVLLIAIYRSFVFVWIPLGAVIFAEITTRSLGYGLTEAGVTVNGQSSSILSILVLGAGTDYALLLVSRYREELRKHDDKHEALALALRTAGPAIVASGATVILALLCLSIAEVNGTAGLGPIGALGILVAMVAMLTLLPALLVAASPRAFWPFVPHGPSGITAPSSSALTARRRVVPAVTIGLLVAVAVGLAQPAIGLLVAVGLPVALLAFFAGFRMLDDRFLLRFEAWASDRRPSDETHGAWRRVGDSVARAPRRVAIATTVLLLVFCLGLANFSGGLTQGNSFRGEVESVQGQELLSLSFPSGANAPTEVIVPDRARVAAITRALQEVDGVAQVRPAVVGADGVLLNAILEPDPYSQEAFDLVAPLRRAAKRAGGPQTLVGGTTAVEQDLRAASARDTRKIIPLVLVVVFLVLVALLRALFAPILLIATVVLSFAAALGVGAVVFDVVFGFPGSDPSLPLFAFVFLVALGIDYNIFLMSRVREETLRHSTREGMLRGLAVTGGVITAAGIVLAGTFLVLAVLPLVFLTEIGFVIAFGVLLDTFLVRSVLVPALVLDIGDRVWWPSALAGTRRPAGDRAREPGEPATESII